MGQVVVVGSINRDVFLRVRSLPAPGETVFAAGTYTGLGGKGANQAVAAARLGAQVVFFGGVGQEDGQPERLALERYGVDVEHVQRVAGSSTGSAFIVVAESGENQIVVSAGANASLDSNRLLRDLEATLRATVDDEGPNAASDRPVVIAQGELGGRVIERLVEAVRRLNGELPAPVRIVLNLAPVVMVPLETLRRVDILVLNAGEALELATAVGAGLPAPALRQGWADDAVAAGQRIADLLGIPTVVTLGGAGVVLAEAGRQEVHFQDAHAVAEVVDTTGAGDCFVGVLGARLAAGQTLHDALRWAAAAAACAVRGRGTTASFPAAATVARAVRDTPLGAPRSIAQV